MNEVMLPEVNPWKGLHFYTEQDHALFFGREQEAERFLRLIQRDILSVLFARSGLGKTSLLRAGVIPKLRNKAFLPVIVRVDYAVSAPPPTLQIAQAILAAATEAGFDAELTDKSFAPDTLWEFFHCYQFWGPRNDLVLPVLILDQFEEAFTLGRQSLHTSEFLAQLADLAENRMPLTTQHRLEVTHERLGFDTLAQNYRVVLSLREDFVPKLDSLRSIMPSVMRNRFALASLNKERSIEVILRPGRRWVSNSVALEIVTVVAGENKKSERTLQTYALDEEIEPAYLSVMCHELFRRMTDLGRNEIDSDLIAAEQGNILDGFYERSFEELDPKTRLFVEDRLLTASGFRGSVPVAEAKQEGISTADLESLVNSRLLRFEDRLGTTHVELSHDRLTDIVKKSRDKRQVETRLEAERRRELELEAKLRRTRQHAMISVLAIVLVLGLIIFYAFGWMIPHHIYSRNFTKRWGMVEPVGILPSSAVEHRAWTLRMTSPGWFRNVQTMEVIDANGQLTPNHSISTYLSDCGCDVEPSRQEKESRYEFVYDNEGHVAYEVARTRSGQFVRGFVYAPRTESLAGPLSSARGTFLGPDGYPQPQRRSRAEFIEFRYDKQGREVEHRYNDREGNPAPGPDKAYRKSWEYDNKGQPVKNTSLDEHGQPINDSAGNASMETKYDTDGNGTEGRALDANGKPTLLKYGYYHVTYKYDEWGRPLDTRYFGLSDEPVIDEELSGAHRITYKYDDRGNLISQKLYGKADEPINAGKPKDKGKGIFEFEAHEQRMTYGLQNRPETIAYFDQNGKPITEPVDGWHRYRIEYDKNGFVSAFNFFDQEEKPVKIKSMGFHRKEIVNDTLGRPTEERYFDAEHKPVITLAGYHLLKSVYNKDSYLQDQTYFGIRGEPVLDQTIGAHHFKQQHDRFGNATRIEYFNEVDKPINNSEGYHREESNYDDYGSVLRSRWYDKDGKPCNGQKGIHDVRYEYNRNGLLIRTAFYDGNNKPTIDKEGIHEKQMEWNDKRQQTRWQIFGLNHQPVEDKEGDHIVLMEYDENGHITKTTRLRADNSPSFYPELEIAIRRTIYDDKNRLIELAFYDQKNHLVKGPNGFAKHTETEDLDGHTIFVDYGTDGKTIFNPLKGYAIRKTGSLRNGDTFTSYHDSDGALITGPEGYAEVRAHLEEGGYLLSIAYFGPDGAPVLGPEGFHRVEQKLGAFGTTKYFDTKNRELTLLNLQSYVSVIYVGEILDIRLPAAKAGLQAGDILWQYGSWSFPEVWNIEHKEHKKGADNNTILENIVQKLFAEGDRFHLKSVPMTVIRKDKPVKLLMLPLPEKKFGIRMSSRSIPVANLSSYYRPGN